MTRAAAGRAGRSATASRGQPDHKSTPPTNSGGPGGYLAESERPWASLVFLLPLVVLYELYALGFISHPAAGSVRTDMHISAFLLMEQFFALLGAAGRHLPAFALVAMLLGAHVARRESWNLRLGTLVGMFLESIVWALPLIVLGWIVARYLPLAAGGINGRLVVLCFGAGLYEELVFRLLGVTVLMLVLHDLLQVQRLLALGVSLATSGVLFAAYHYLSPSEDFRMNTFLFRTAAGVYFGLLWVLRGFGVTAGSHVAYDLIVVSLLAR